MPKNILKKISAAGLLVFISFELFGIPYVGAQSVGSAAATSTLQQEIDERNQVIQELQQQIDSDNSKISDTSKKAQTLQNTLNSLNTNIDSLNAQISKTQANLDKTTYSIAELNDQISQSEQSVDTEKKTLASLIDESNQGDFYNLFEILIEYKSLSDAWDYIDKSWQLQNAINNNVKTLQTNETTLQASVDEREKEKGQIQQYQSTLSDQKQIVESSKQTQSTLLKQTKNQESTYKADVAANTAKMQAFQSELYGFESQLQLTVNPGTIPSFGGGVLAWPTAPPYHHATFRRYRFRKIPRIRLQRHGS